MQTGSLSLRTSVAAGAKKTKSCQNRKARPSCGLMSEEQLKAFLEAVKTDAGLQEKLKKAKNADAIAEIAKAAGFMISANDIKNTKSSPEALSDEELEGVTGGGQNIPRLIPSHALLGPNKQCRHAYIVDSPQNQIDFE